MMRFTNSMLYLFCLGLFCLLANGGASDIQSHSQPKKELIAVVHPGPGKTGSTHFQTFLVEAENELLERNIAVWPDFYPAFEKCKQDGRLTSKDLMMKTRVKSLAFYYAYYKSCPLFQEIMRSFIQTSAEHGRHVVLSSESLHAGDEPISNILDMLVDANYQIHGLYAYRFPMSWFISRYGEHIKTHSISSWGYVRRVNQYHVSFFSDYLISHWDVYMKPNSLDQFYTFLLKYPGFRLSVVDLYGSIAAGKLFEEVALCVATGLTCDRSLFDNSNTITAHESESLETIYARQGVIMFDIYARKLNCTINSEMNTKGKRFFMELMPRWNVSACPVTPVNVASYARKSIEIDRDFRRRYRQFFVEGNVTANEMLVNPLPVVHDIDRQVAMSRGSECNVNMRRYLSEARKQGLCR